MGATDADRLAERLRDAARSGELCDLRPELDDAALDPGSGAGWPPEQQVPASVLRSVLTDPGLRADPRGLRLRGALVTGTLDLRHATVPCPLVLLRSRLEQRALLAHARIPHLDLQDSHLPGLSLDGARVDGGAFLGRLTATGIVRAVGVHVGGELNLSGATLVNEGEVALSLDGARIDGGAFLGGLTARGMVRAVGAHVGGELSLAEAELVNKGKVALSLDGARVDGAAFLDGLTTTGLVRAVAAHVRGQLSLIDATLTNEDAVALDLQGLEAGALLLHGLRTQGGGLALTRARVTDLVVDEDRPRGGLPGPLLAAGWSIADVHGVVRTDRRVAAEWLATAPEFVPQPWHALAAVFERNGQPEDARHLRRQAAHRTAKAAPWPARAARLAYGALVGYGYSGSWAAGWLLAALLAALLLSGSQAATFVPSDPSSAAAAVARTSATGVARAPGTSPSADRRPAGADEAATVTGATGCARFGGRYPCFRPVLYSLDVVLPPNIATGQADAWRPSSTWLVAVLSSLKTLGWLLTALLVAGVTGLLRRT